MGQQSLASAVPCCAEVHLQHTGGLPDSAEQSGRKSASLPHDHAPPSALAWSWQGTLVLQHPFVMSCHGAIVTPDWDHALSFWGLT
eukprot:214111-Rhodomonas_salina.1